MRFCCITPLPHSAGLPLCTKLCRCRLPNSPGDPPVGRRQPGRGPAGGPPGWQQRRLGRRLHLTAGYSCSSSCCRRWRRRFCCLPHVGRGAECGGRGGLPRPQPDRRGGEGGRRLLRRRRLRAACCAPRWTSLQRQRGWAVAVPLLPSGWLLGRGAPWGCLWRWGRVGRRGL